MNQKINNKDYFSPFSVSNSEAFNKSKENNDNKETSEFWF